MSFDDKKKGPPGSPGEAFLSLVEEVERHQLWDAPGVAASLFTLGLNPQDERARELLIDQLTPHRIATTLFPNPFEPLPPHGAVDGPFRFAKVSGQEDNPIGLTEAELNCNVGIFGQAGFGKTVTIVNLLVSILEAP